MKQILKYIVTLMLVLGTVTQAHAIIISATERGTYRSDTYAFGTGGSGTATGNYLTGNHNGNEYRSFFNFDLSALSDTITSATFIISLDGTFGGSPDTTETLGLFDVTSSIPALIGNTGGATAFNDLGTGVLYGSSFVSTSATSGNIIISMNASGLADLNNAIGGDFAIGGALLSLSGANEEFVFGSSLGVPLTQLDLDISIPEPATLLLLGSGLVGLGVFRKKFRKK